MYPFIVPILDILIQNPLYAVAVLIFGFFLFLIAKSKRNSKSKAEAILFSIAVIFLGLVGLGLWFVTLLGIWPFASTQPITFLASNSSLESGKNSMVVAIDSLEFTDTLEGLDSIFSGNKTFKSGQGAFLLINAKLTNLTSQEVCLHGQDFKVSYNNQMSTMSRDILRIASNHYNRPSPDFYWGQCLKPNEQSLTFLVFDIPTSGQLALQVAQQQVSLGEIAELRKTFAPK